MTENNQNLVPEIRFNGFTNAWVQSRFGELYKVCSGYAFKYQDYCDNGVGLINGESIQYGKIDGSNMNYLPEDFLNQYSNFALKENDIVLGLNRPIISGKLKISKIPREFNDSLLYQRAGKINYVVNMDNNFSFALLSQEILKHTLKEAVGSDQPFISTSKLDKWKMMIPKKEEEQKHIGNFFAQLDNLITPHQRKLDGLRELKKGYLQQMFPQTGERVPRVRFAGFSGEWQERKLGELFKERNERSSEGELISVTINSGVMKASELERKDNSSEDKSNYKKVEVGDIAYNSMRMWQGASGISNYAGILSPAYTVIIPDEGVDSLFFSYMFKLTRMLKIFQSFSQGLTSDTWNLKFPLLKEISVTVPCSNEQAAISDFFRIIDEQITAQSIKLEQLGQLKAAYLQRMFI